MSSNTKKPDVFDFLQFNPLLSLVPVGGALAHFAAWPQKWSKGQRVALGAAGLLAGINLIRWQFSRFITPKPKYETLLHEGSLELRHYPKLIVAETHVHKGFDASLDEGFSRLAEFIYGRNHQRHGERDPAATVVNPGEKLNMTAPVITRREAAGHAITFVMPPDKAIDQIPVPLDHRVEVHEVPERTVAALTFRGEYDEQAFRKASKELLEKVKAHQWQPKGSPALAAYDAPAVIPMLRHNEVWVEVEA